MAPTGTRIQGKHDPNGMRCSLKNVAARRKHVRLRVCTFGVCARSIFIALGLARCSGVAVMLYGRLDESLYMVCCIFSMTSKSECWFAAHSLRNDREGGDRRHEDDQVVKLLGHQHH